MSLVTRITELSEHIALTLKTLANSAITREEATAIASGSTQGLEQALLAGEGQVGLTVLAVAYTYYQGSEGPTPNNKAQITSLGEGNTIFVYASGADLLAGNIQEGPVFLGLGEVYVIENVQPGTIITASQGAYGFSQQRNGNDESPMALLSLGLSFKDSFLYAFRSSQTYRGGASGADNEGWIHLVNGPIASQVSFYDGNGVVVQGQENISLAPWQYLRLYTEGNKEYRIVSTNNVMVGLNANMDIPSPSFYDSRLVLPVTNDGITWPRSGFMSAPYANTRVRYWVNDGAAWDVGSGAAITVTPGNPKDMDAAQPTGTGANDADYEPKGATRFKADGLISGYSGADSAGLEATPLCPVSTFTQRIALPLHIRVAGDGGNNGIALASIYEGIARVYQWNPVTKEAEIVSFIPPGGGTAVTEVLLQRRNGGVTTANDQNFPASASISAAGGAGTGDPEAYDMVTDFNGGYVEVDVPAMCVFNSEQNENGQTDHTFRGTSGDNVVGIHADDDEQLTFGITPNEIKPIIQKDGGLLYRAIAGIPYWELL